MSSDAGVSTVTARAGLCRRVKRVFCAAIPKFVIDYMICLVTKTRFTDSSRIKRISRVVGALKRLFGLTVPMKLLLLVPYIVMVTKSLVGGPAVPIVVVSSTMTVMLTVLIRKFSFASYTTDVIDKFGVRVLRASVSLRGVMRRIPGLLRENNVDSVVGATLVTFYKFSFVKTLAMYKDVRLVLRQVVGRVRNAKRLVALAIVLKMVVVAMVKRTAIAFLVVNKVFHPRCVGHKLRSGGLSESLRSDVAIMRPLMP